MRDFSRIDGYLDELTAEVYDQPPDDGHQAAIDEVITNWLPRIEADSVLDVGCAQGQAIATLQRFARRVVGVTLGNDRDVARSKGYEVYGYDISFLPFADNEFDMIFARHVIEHSPMPLITLMEWHRVARNWLILIAPDLDHFGPRGRNHYYVLRPDHWARLLARAGWEIVESAWQRNLEYRWLCRKIERKAED